MNDEQVGRRIKRFRKAKNWTQAQVADAADLTKPTIIRLEAGKSVSFSTLRRVLGKLGKSFAELEAPFELEEGDGKDYAIVRDYEEAAIKCEAELSFGKAYLLPRVDKILNRVVLEMKPCGVTRLRSHGDGGEWVHVLQGKACVHLGGEDSSTIIKLEAGQEVLFRGTELHRYANLSETESALILITWIEKDFDFDKAHQDGRL